MRAAFIGLFLLVTLGAVCNAQCTYNLASLTATYSAAGSSGSVGLTATCGYFTASNSPWITLTSGQSGTGSGTISYIVAPNQGPLRIGTFNVLTAGGSIVATFTITQAAAACTTLVPNPEEFTYTEPGSGTVSFSTGPCSWTASSNSGWLTLPQTSGNSSGFNFNVAANNTGQPGIITLNTSAGTQKIVVNEAQLCTYQLTGPNGLGSLTVPSTGGGGSFNIATQTGCTIPTPTTDDPSLFSFVGFSGNSSVGFSTISNPPVASAHIFVGSSTFLMTVAPSTVVNCTASSAGTTIRAEGITEMPADLLLACSSSGTPLGLVGDVQVTFTGPGSVPVPISNVLLSGGQTDALLLVNNPGGGVALGVNAFRGLPGPNNSLVFPGVPITSPSGSFYSLRITNARLNANSLGIPSGSGTHLITASVAINAPLTVNVTGTPTVATSTQGSSFSLPAFTAGPNSGQTIQPVQFTEKFASAFKIKLAANQNPSSSGVNYFSESGYVNTTVLGPQTGVATNGTRFLVTFTGVAGGVTVYAPVAVLNPSTGTSAQLVSADNTGTGGTPLLGTTTISGVAYQPVTITSGSGTATWEVTSSNPNTIETLTFNVLSTSSNGLPGTTGSIAPDAGPGSVSLTAPIPRFLAPAAGPQQTGMTLAVTAGIPGQMVPALVRQEGGRHGFLSNLQPHSGSANPTTATLVLQNDSTAAVSSPSIAGSVDPNSLISQNGCVVLGGTCQINADNTGFTATVPSLAPGQAATVFLEAISINAAANIELSAGFAGNGTNGLANGLFSTFLSTLATSNVTFTKTPVGSFSPGANGSYTIAISGGSLSGQEVSVIDALPEGMTLVSMSGQGWLCTELFTCLITSATPPLSPITVTVNVSSGVPFGTTLTNSAVLTLNGALLAMASAPTSIGNCNIAPAITTATFAARGGTRNLTVNATAGCAWSAVSNSAFIVINSGTGTGTGTINYTVEPNTGPVRSSTITVGGQNFTITQVGVQTTPVTVGAYHNGTWYLPNGTVTQFGLPGDLPVVGDWTGNGVVKIGVFRPSTQAWYLDSNGNGVYDPGVDITGQFGIPGDMPVVGDWTGNGVTKVGIYRPSLSLWALDVNGTATWASNDVFGYFGLPGDTPIVGDWTGTGTTKVGIFRSSNAIWALDNDGNLAWDQPADTYGQFGFPNDLPVVGDWTNSGITRVGIFRPSNALWALNVSGTLTWTPPTDTDGFFGFANDTPIVGDWRGIGQTQVGIYRPGAALWALDIAGTLSWAAPPDTYNTIGPANATPVVARFP
jgi:hypothetical protein